MSDSESYHDKVNQAEAKVHNEPAAGPPCRDLVLTCFVDPQGRLGGRDYVVPNALVYLPSHETQAQQLVIRLAEEIAREQKRLEEEKPNQSLARETSLEQKQLQEIMSQLAASSALHFSYSATLQLQQSQLEHKDVLLQSYVQQLQEKQSQHAVLSADYASLSVRHDALAATLNQQQIDLQQKNVLLEARAQELQQKESQQQILQQKMSERDARLAQSQLEIQDWTRRFDELQKQSMMMTDMLSKERTARESEVLALKGELEQLQRKLNSGRVQEVS